MHPLFVVSIGVAIVIVGVLFVRLHAFLALILAALVVAILTSPAEIQKFGISQRKYRVTQVQDHEGTVRMVMDVGSNAKPPVESLVHVYETVADAAAGEPKAVFATLPKSDWQVDPATQKPAYPTARFVRGSTDIRVGQIVIAPAELQAALNAPKKTIGERVASAFGSTCTSIGILIAMAAIIGKCLLDSGSADRIVRSTMKVVGERGAPLAFIGSGFMLGIPVFFDTVFYLMIPLGKALGLRTGRNYLMYVLTIVIGGTMAHSLVPPTPGPLYVADALGVDIGVMILAGCLVGVFTCAVGWCFARFMNARYELPLRESAEFSLEEVRAIANRDESELRPLALALLPILLPVFFIAGFTILQTLNDSLQWLQESSTLFVIAKTLGNKNIALTMAAVIGMATLVWQKRSSLRELSTAVQAALASGGVIILITAAGGAFGGMMRQTGVAGLIESLPSMSSTIVIVLAFLITTAIRTAQGSATVAMITAVGVLGSFASPETLGCHPVYLALAIGCGSKPIAWMNDSGFWVICTMSGMEEREGLKYITPLSILMGMAGLIVTVLAANFFPLSQVT